MEPMLKLYILFGDKVERLTGNYALKVFEKVGGKEVAKEIKRVEFTRRQLVMQMRQGKLTAAQVYQELSKIMSEETVERLGKMFARHWANILREWAEYAEMCSKEE